jgi:hypothetical protein
MQLASRAVARPLAAWGLALEQVPAVLAAPVLAVVLELEALAPAGHPFRIVLGICLAIVFDGHRLSSMAIRCSALSTSARDRR